MGPGCSHQTTQQDTVRVAAYYFSVWGVTHRCVLLGGQQRERKRTTWRELLEALLLALLCCFSVVGLERVSSLMGSTL